MSDLESINTNRVQYGIAMAHKMLKGLSEHIVMGTRPALERLCEWKDARTDDFKKPFPEPSMSKDYWIQDLFWFVSYFPKHVYWFHDFTHIHVPTEN